MLKTTPLPLLLVLAPRLALAGDHVTFTNVAEDPLVGLDYVRAPDPARIAAAEAFQEQSLVEPLPQDAIALMPSRPYGMPGLVVFDYDGDGDHDLYITNGAGVPNSLFTNQRAQSGVVSFVDDGIAAGADAMDQASAGACAGDVDNDGDEDLFVMGLADRNVLLENLGDGTFSEVTDSGIEGLDEASGSCSVGDVNGDGRLDLVVANSHDPTTQLACFAVPFDDNQHNQLYINQGDLHFEDQSALRGIEDQAGYGPLGSQPGITWATAVVDVDLDGDADIVFGDDQCAFPHSGLDGIDRGFVHVMLNDGTGWFTDAVVDYNGQASLGQNRGVGYHMGLAFGDLQCDGQMDMFVSNVGDYDFPTMGVPYGTGDASTRWQLGQGDGTFSDPGTGALGATPFGWGNAVFDYDNDGDQDLLALGGLDTNFLLWIDNPGMLLSNDGHANFEYEADALRTDYTGLNTQGVAIGDFDGDGAPDIVTTTNWEAPAGPRLTSPNQPGSVFDATARFIPVFAPTDAGFVHTGAQAQSPEVGVTLELNDGTPHGSITVRVRGSVGLTELGAVNRSGIGAVLTFTPRRGAPVMTPVIGGGSFISQDSLDKTFGLGRSGSGTLEVLWPGGVRNRLYRVRAGESVSLPEIPCSYDGDFDDRAQYMSCVRSALRDLVDAGAIEREAAKRLRQSARRAWNEG